jgi:hypothetical protein
METKEVTLSGKAITLGTPASLAMRWDIASRAPPKVSLKSHQHDLASFGAAVMDELLGRGHDFSEVNEAAMVAYHLAVSGLVTEREVKEAESFTEAPAEDPHV